MIKLIAVSMILLSGCTCINYMEIRTNSDESPTNITKEMSYCSSKDMIGLHIIHGDTIITLDKANNDAGEVISKIADKVPVLLP